MTSRPRIMLLLALIGLTGCSSQSFSRLDHLRDWKNTTTSETCIWNSTNCSAPSASSTTGQRQIPMPSRGLWVEQLPVPPIVVATSDALAEGPCKRQLRRYIEELGNGTLWATQMYDSSVKYPFGIIDGHIRHLGSFDQCIRIAARIAGSATEEVSGRYCLVDYKYKQRNEFLAYRGKLDFDFDPNGSAWEAVKEKGDFRRIKRYALQMALCVPAACKAEEVRQALQAPYDAFAEANGLSIKISVDEKNCQAYGEEPEFGFGAYVYCGVLAFIAALVVVSSLYDGTLVTEEEKRGTTRALQMLLCFSAKRNLQTIFEVHYNHRGLDTIHMIRFFSMCLVLVGHRMMQYYYNPVVNERYLELTFDVPSFIMVHNGPIIVDGFFAIGGLLTCYGLLDQFDKSKRMNFLGLTFIRFLRFTPAYALVMFFYAYIFQHLGSGPEWQTRIVSESDNCAATWWANLFYLNNYFTMNQMCMFQSWYLSVDFHLYVLAICILYAFWKLPRKIGYSLLGSATFVSILIPFYYTYVHRVQPLFIGFPFLDNLMNDEYFVNYYVKTHMRMTAYLVGVISGAILHDYKDASWRISKRWAHCLYILFAVLMTIKAQSLGHQYYNPNANPSALETALYASLHRGCFALGFCSIFLLITMGDGLDFHYNFLTPRWVQPLGRLTYSVFLCHNIIQMYHIGTVRASRTYSIHSAFWDFVPDVVYSFSFALLIAISIEGPFRKLEKHFLTKRVASPDKVTSRGASEERTQAMESKKID